jgi:hypothetical protein
MAAPCFVAAPLPPWMLSGASSVSPDDAGADSGRGGAGRSLRHARAAPFAWIFGPKGKKRDPGG